MNLIEPFKKKGLTYEYAVPMNARSVPTDHHAYNYVWKLIDEYSDKRHIHKLFSDLEKKITDTDGDFDFIYKLCSDEKFFKDIRAQWADIEQEMRDTDVGISTMGNMLLDYISAKYGDEEWCDISFLKASKSPANLALINDAKAREEVFQEKCAPIAMIMEKSFADAIWQKYNLDDMTHHNINLPLHSTANIILNTKKRADAHFLDIKRNLDYEGSTFHTQESHGPNNSSERRQIVTRILEDDFNLLFNPKNKVYYMSNGQGKMISFDASNDKYFFNPLHNKFYEKVARKDGGTYDFKLIFSRPDFYKLGLQYCTQVQEPESYLVSFRNCFYNCREKKIYELDYRFPRLAMKSSDKNFIFDRDLTGKGGALEAVFKHCFTEKDQEIILQYLGRALFEKGYTEHQEILMFLGKGGTGKTTFATALSRIFDKVSNMAADKLDNTNRFAFSQLPDADFLIMDEITNAQNSFVDMLKSMSSGSDSLPIEIKNQNAFDLPAEYIPMMIGIGNRLKVSLYLKFKGNGIARRFCTIFLKNSILEAKVMTDDNGEILYDEDGNEIRGAYHKEELFKDECIEWLVQQVVLAYDPNYGDLLSSDEALEKAKIATYPEEYVIKNHVEVVRSAANPREAIQDDTAPVITATELLEKINAKLDDYMLERTTQGEDDSRLTQALTKALQLDTVRKGYDREGNIIFRGFYWHDETFLNDDE